MIINLVTPVLFVIIVSLVLFIVGYFSGRVINKLFTTKVGMSGIGHRLLMMFKIAYYVLLVLIWIFSILMYFGIDIKILITGVGVSGLIFTLIGKDYLMNFFSSVTFLLNGVFKIGDKIKIGSIEGIVIDITINYVILKNTNGEKVFFPNKKLSGEPIEHLYSKK